MAEGLRMKRVSFASCHQTKWNLGNSPSHQRQQSRNSERWLRALEKDYVVWISSTFDFIRYQINCPSPWDGLKLNN